MRKLIFTIFYLFFSYVLFSQTTDVDSSANSIINLFELSLDELLTLEVKSATKFGEQVKDLPNSVYIITKNDIQSYGYRSLSEALQHVPGFFMMDDHTFYKENFGVRGFYRDEWNQNIIFLVNGIRQRSGYDFNNKLTYINVPIQSIERIEVIKGPASVSYGSGAFLGVVNIITIANKQQVSDINLSLGPLDTYGVGFNFREKINDLQLTVNAGFSKTDGIDQNYNDMGLDTTLSSSAFMYEEQGFMSVSVEKGGLFSTISIDRNQNKRPIVFPPFISSIYEGETDFIAMRYLLGYNHKFSDKFQINTSYQYQYQEEELKLDFAGLDNDQIIQNSTVDAHEFDINGKYNVNENISFSLGSNLFVVTHSKDLLDMYYINLTNMHRELISPMYMWGAYMRLNWQLSEKLTLKGGLRLDNIPEYDLIIKHNVGHQYMDPDTSILPPFYEITYTYPNNGVAFLPEVSLNYELNKNNSLKLMYGEAINRLPIFRISDAATLGITPEYIRSLELNYVGVVKNKLKINSSIIFNYLYNLISIEFYVEDGVTLQDPSNGGEISTYGFELELDYRPMKNFGIILSGNYYKSIDSDYTEIYPAFSPQFLGYLNILYQLKPFTFALTNHYVSIVEPKYNHKLTDPTDINSEEIGRVGDAAPAYINTGLNIRYRPDFIKGAYANLRVSNLLDQKMYYPANDFNAWATKGTLGIGRTFLLSIGYEF